ncbi:MAG TPA: hypothetical protein VFH54_11600 [Mycobacteriales bacterium]|nr:hypothetical protein [Mycobacteriales bacterium]
MTVLHYGSDLRIRLDEASTKHVTENVSSHASRGGWVTATDMAGKTWTFLVTTGIPIWLEEAD